MCGFDRSSGLLQQAERAIVVSSSAEYAWKVASAVVESGAGKIQIECNSTVAGTDAIILAADLASEASKPLEGLHLKGNVPGELGLNALQQMRNHRQEVSGGSFDLVIQALDPSQDCIGQEVEPKPSATLRILASQRKRFDHSEPVSLATQIERLLLKARASKRRPSTASKVRPFIWTLMLPKQGLT